MATNRLQGDPNGNNKDKTFSSEGTIEISFLDQKTHNLQMLTAGFKPTTSQSLTDNFHTQVNFCGCQMSILQ